MKTAPNPWGAHPQCSPITGNLATGEEHSPSAENVTRNGFPVKYREFQVRSLGVLA